MNISFNPKISDPKDNPSSNTAAQLLTSEQTRQFKAILTKIQYLVPSLSLQVKRIQTYSNQFSIKAFWKQLNLEYQALRDNSNQVTNQSRECSFKILEEFYKNGNKQINNIHAITSEIQVQVNQTPSHLFNVKIKQEFEEILKIMLKDINAIIYEFTNIFKTFLQSNSLPRFGSTYTFQRNNNKPNQKQQTLTSLKGGEVEKIKKEYQDRIDEMTYKFEGKIKQKDQIFIQNSNERLKQRQKLQQEIQKLQNQSKKHQQTIKTLQITAVRYQNTEKTLNEYRIRIQDMQSQHKKQTQELRTKIRNLEGQKESMEKNKKQMDEKSKSSKQQLQKLQDQVRRTKQTFETTKTQDNKLKQNFQIKSNQLKTKTNQLEDINIELIKVSEFIELEVNHKLVAITQEMSKINGRKQSSFKIGPFIPQKLPNISNLSPTKEIQFNLLELLNSFKSLSSSFKDQVLSINNKINSYKQELRNFEDKISQNRNQINKQKEELFAQEKQLNFFQQKYTTLSSYESLLQAKKQQMKKYEEICVKIKEKQNIYEKQKFNVENIKSEFNTRTNIQELQQKIQQLKTEKQVLAHELQTKFQIRLAQQLQKKEKQMQFIYEKISLKEGQNEEMINEDRKNKNELLKLSKELQALKKTHLQHKQHFDQKTHQYEFRINKLVEEKQSLLKNNLSNSPQNQIKKINHTQSPLNDKLFKKSDDIFPIPGQKDIKDKKKPDPMTQRQKQKSISFHNEFQQLKKEQERYVSTQKQLQTLMEEKEEIQLKISRLKKEMQKILDENHQLALNSVGKKQKSAVQQHKQKVEQLECQYEEKQKLIAFYESSLKGKDQQIAKIKKMSKTVY